MTGGHDAFWGIPSDGRDAVTRAVRHQVSAGAQVIKTAATGGAYRRAEGEEIGQAELTYDELAAIAAEAHRFGLRASAHALGTTGIRNAVIAGIDTIEHGVSARTSSSSTRAGCGRREKSPILSSWKATPSRNLRKVWGVIRSGRRTTIPGSVHHEPV
jgi:imidazolonepropionase-like amidohydrolase